MTTKTDEQEREDFEAAYIANFQFAAAKLGKFDRDANDDYEDVQVLVGWRMWQAGRAALQSRDREESAYESGRRCGLGFGHSVVSEILRKHYHGSGTDGLKKLVQQAADAIAEEMDAPTAATTDTDHARRIEGERT